MARDACAKVTLTLGDGDRDLANFLDEQIYAFNVAATGIGDGRLLSIRAEDDEDQLVAALTGWTWGGCGYVDVLWVDDAHRGKGVGSKLLDAAEAEAVARECVWMVLSTHTFQAPDFYRARGYVEAGRTPDYPHGHAQVHLRKALRESMQSSRT